MPLYHVALKQGSRRDTKPIRAKSVNDILAFFKKISTYQVIKISEILYEANDDKREDNPLKYDSMARVFVSNKISNLSTQLYIPHVSVDVTEKELIEAIQIHLLVKDKPITSITSLARY